MKQVLRVSGLWGLGFVVACAAQATPFENGGAGGDAAAPPPKDGGSGTFFDSGSTPPPPDYDTGSPPPPGQDASQPPPTCTSVLIDDMDHGDNSILKVDGRTGFWYTYNDGTTGGSQTPPIGAFAPTVITGPGIDDAGASADGGGDGGAVDHAAETAGSGFTNWGAGMGFDLDNLGGNTPKQTYSVTGCAYTGLQFWARVGPTSTTAVRLNVPDKNTDPSGNVCAPVAKCNDHFGESLTLSSTWTLVTVKWSDLKQQGWGTPQEPALDTGNLVGVQFQFAPSATFELWIADISFTK